MYTVKDDFYTKEVNQLLHEEEKRGLKKMYFLSTLMVSSVGYIFTTMEPLLDESVVFQVRDDVINGGVKPYIPPTPEPIVEPEPVKEVKLVKQFSIKQVNQKPATSTPKSGGDLNSRVTNTQSVLTMIAGPIRGINLTDPTEVCDGAAKGLDAMLLGNNELAKGGGTGSIRTTSTSGPGDGNGSGNSTFGSPDGVEGILASMNTTSRVQMTRRNTKIAVHTPSMLTGGTEMNNRSKEDIRKVVMDRVGGLKYLYNKYLQEHPELKGKITIKMVIAPSGKVIRVIVLESSLGVIELDSEIAKRVKRWKFDKVAGGSTTVVYPFSFSS